MKKPIAPPNRVRREGCWQAGNCDEHTHRLQDFLEALAPIAVVVAALIAFFVGSLTQ